MRFHAAKILVCCISLGCYSSLAFAQNTLIDKQKAAQADKRALQKQIKELHEKITAGESMRDDIASSLKSSEEKISSISKILHDYDVRFVDLEKSLQKLQDSKTQQQDLLVEQQAALAKQLRAQYASGLSSWTALLSGKDPQDINRDLTYLSYVLHSRVLALDKINATSQRLDDLSKQITVSQKELNDLRKASVSEQEKLKKQQANHAIELAKIKDNLQDKQNQAAKLKNQDKLLGDLIKQLDVEIAKAKKAAEERKAQAEEKARQLAAAKKVEADKQAAEARQAEAAKLSKEKPAEKPSGQDIQVDLASHDGGLQKGLLPPVKGQVLGRFGSQRPDGGVWRGIVLKTAEDTNVQAVASGKVVYSAWLSGFGNLLIIDHGQGYLSIYGYNKANMKDVGDLVKARETVAKVGSTGGQVEPGLYFELRKDGAPINPELWLKR